MNQSNPKQFMDDFFEGQKACQRGEDCTPSRSDAFKRGYMAQYEREQVMTELARGSRHGS